MKMTKETGERIDRYFAREIKAFVPDLYPSVVAIWNRAIAAAHGIKFDTSHDREKTRTPSG